MADLIPGSGLDVDGGGGHGGSRRGRASLIGMRAWAMWAPEHRERVVRVVRALRPWFDPKSRRPLVVLFLVSLGVFLWPLAFDVGSALYSTLPRWFRRSLGQAAFLPVVAAGL